MVKKDSFFGGVEVVVLVWFFGIELDLLYELLAELLVYRLLKALSSNFLFWHSHYESNRSIAGLLIRFDLSFL